MTEPHGEPARPPLTRAPFETRDFVVLGAAAAAAAMFALVAHFAGMPKLQPLVGLIVILAIAYALFDQPARHRSPHRRLGPDAADRLRAARPEDDGGTARLPAPRRR